MCGMCWSPLLSEPYLLPCCLLSINQAQSHVQASISPLQKSRCILSCLKSFHQKNRQAAHKRTYFRQKKNRPIPRTWTSACLLPVCSDRFLPPPKLSGGLPAAMVLLPHTEDGDAAQATKLPLLYTKDTIATAGGREFQTYEPVVCRAKRAAAACMKESEKGKGREEKQTTLGNPPSL